jgi:hypothetical protein
MDKNKKQFFRRGKMRPVTGVSKKSGVRADPLDDVPYVAVLAAEVVRSRSYAAQHRGRHTCYN